MKKLVYISLILALFSCTKFGKNVRVKGRAINPVTGEGIEGIKIRLIGGNSGGWNGSAKILKTVTTDAEGNFDISKLTLNYTTIDADQGGNYYEIGWFVDGKQTADLHPKIGKTMHVDYHAVPYGKLAIHIKNNSCFDSNDNVKIYFDGEDYNSHTFNTGIYTELNGCVDITDAPIKSAMGNKFFHWVVTKNSVLTTYYDTVFVQEDGITYFDLFY